MGAAMYGADPAELDRLAEEFSKIGDELDNEGKQLSLLLNRLSWLGDVATDYRGEWTSVQIPKIDLSTQFLKAASGQLHNQAREQRAASRADGSSSPYPTPGGGSKPTDGGKPPPGTETQQYPPSPPGGPPSTIDKNLAKLKDLASASPVDQLAWWNTLTPEEQAALIAANAVDVLALKGLPLDARHAAELQYAKDEAPNIVTGQSGTSLNGELSIRYVKVSAELSAETTQHADGSVTVTFGASAGAGAQLDGGIASASASRTQSIEGTYHFNSQAEADAFLNRLKVAATPGFDNLHPEIAIGLVAAAYAPNLESVKLEVGASGEVKYNDGANAAGLNVGVGVSVESNRQTGAITVAAHGSFDASASSTLVGVTPLGNSVKLSGDVGASLKLENGQPTSLTFSCDLAAAGGTTVGGPVSASASGTVSAHATVTYDLTDPAVAASASKAMELIKIGDVKGAAAQLAHLQDRSTIQIQTFTGTESSSGFDAKVVSGGVSTHTKTAATTILKPPGSGFFTVHP